MSTAPQVIAPNLPASAADRRGDGLRFLRRPTGTSRERALLVLAFAALTALRFPNALWHGRFWAEEGSVFYANAWSLPWWQALIFPHTGYLNFVANVSGVLAYLAPVRLAPYVSSGVALLVHCCPAILVAFARDAWLQKQAVVLAALVIIATPPGTEEVWLNAINSQAILTLCVGVILGLETRTGPLGALQKSLLWLAPLSGPGPWCLVPLFFLRAVIDRSWPRAAQGAILLSGVLIQVVFFFDPSQRQLGIDPLLLNAVILVKHILLPLFGHDQAAVLASHVASFVTGSESKSLLFVVIPLFLAVGCVTAIKPRQPPLWLFLAGVGVAAVGYYGAQNDKLFLISVAGSARYAYTPQVLFGLTALSWGVIHSGRTAVLAQLLVIWMLFVGLHDYFWPSAPTFASGPDWREEVAKWEQDPLYRLKIWPRGWTMRLPAPDLSSSP